MKRLIRWFVAWLLYAVGHTISIVVAALCRVEGWMLATSHHVQGPSGCGPWEAE